MAYATISNFGLVDATFRKPIVHYFGDLPYTIFYLVDGPIQYVYHGEARRKSGPERLPCTIQATLYSLPDGSAAVGRNATITIGDSEPAGLVPYFEVFFDGNTPP